MKSCGAILKTGKRKGEVCGSKSYSSDFCGRHRPYKSKPLKKSVLEFEYDENEDDNISIVKESVGDDRVYEDALKELVFFTSDEIKNTSFINDTITGIDTKDRLSRLSKELKFLEKNMPLHYNSTILLRVDEEKPYYMRALIFAPNDTPYDSGCFEFDIYLPEKYPAVPPTVLLRTTYGGRFRFSPNLYSNGKVCLSLLGTWRGRNKNEEWNPKSSNIWQVLISIQSAILGSKYPYFDEPGVEAFRNTSSGDLRKRIAENGGYEILREGTMLYAIIDIINNPPAVFEEAIIRHFKIKRDHIIRNCMQWIEEAINNNSLDHLEKLEAALEKFEKIEKIK